MTSTSLIRSALLAATVVSTVGCDQVTKHFARTELLSYSPSFFGGLLRLTLAQNAGGFLSLGASLPNPLRTALFVFGVSLGLLLAIAYLMRGPQLPYLSVVAAALVLAGGLSNLIDRVLRDGHVTDFMIVGIGPLHTGVFNIADLAITFGGIAFVLSMQLGNNGHGVRS